MLGALLVDVCGSSRQAVQGIFAPTESRTLPLALRPSRYSPDMLRCYSCSAVCRLLRAACCSAAEKPYIASMGIYVTKASALKELLEQHMPDANDFGNEVIPGANKLGYPVQVRGTRHAAFDTACGTGGSNTAWPHATAVLEVAGSSLHSQSATCRERITTLSISVSMFKGGGMCADWLCVLCVWCVLSALLRTAGLCLPGLLGGHWYH